MRVTAWAFRVWRRAGGLSECPTWGASPGPVEMLLWCSSPAAPEQGYASPCTLCALEPTLTWVLAHLSATSYTHARSQGQPWLRIVRPRAHDPCGSLSGSTGRSHPSLGMRRGKAVPGVGDDPRSIRWRCLPLGVGFKCSKGEEQLLESHAHLALDIKGEEQLDFPQNRRKFHIEMWLGREKLKDLAVSCLEITKNNCRWQPSKPS